MIYSSENLPSFSRLYPVWMVIRDATVVEVSLNLLPSSCFGTFDLAARLFHFCTGQGV